MRTSRPEIEPPQLSEEDKRTQIAEQIEVSRQVEEWKATHPQCAHTWKYLNRIDEPDKICTKCQAAVTGPELKRTPWWNRKTWR